MTEQPTPIYPRLIYSPTQDCLHTGTWTSFAMLRGVTLSTGHRLAACWNLCLPWSTEAVVDAEARRAAQATPTRGPAALLQLQALLNGSAVAPDSTPAHTSTVDGSQQINDALHTVRGLLDALVRIEDLAAAGASHATIAREAQAALWVASGRVASGRVAG